jgi:peroxiredoxin
MSKAVANTPPVTASRSGRERIAALLVLALGLPLVVGFGRAIVDGETQRREGPLRAILGDETFEKLARGEKTETGYLGRTLTAPDFTLPDRYGKPWTLSKHRGKTIVLNFWSITCPPCVEEMPSILDLHQLAKQHDDLEIVTITTDENWKAVAPLFPPHTQLTVLFDPERKVVKEKFGTTMFPETWVIDPQGIIRMRVDGPRDWSAAISLDAIEASKL